jgi:hypothetical protein
MMRAHNSLPCRSVMGPMVRALEALGQGWYLAGAGFFAAHIAMAAPLPENANWCDALIENLNQIPADGPQDASHLQKVISMLPGGGAELKHHLESRLINPENTSAIRHNLQEIATKACISPAASMAFVERTSGSYREELNHILSSAPFLQQKRLEEDALDLLINRLVNWFELIFESEGMQFYARFSRAFYLSFLGVVSFYFAWRIWRGRRRTSRDLHPQEDETPEHRHRKKDSLTWRREADKQFQQGDYRKASEACHFALLGHLEERGVLSFTRFLTNGEIQHAAPSSLSDSLQGIFFACESNIYGGGADASSTQFLMHSIDRFLGAAPGAKP